MALVDLLAIYGASLSTVVAIERVWSARPRLEVQFELGNFDGDFGIYISVRNRTGHASYIDAIGVQYSGCEATFNSKLKGVRLDPHSVARMHLSNERIRSILQGVTDPTMRAFVTDALGRTKYGPPYDMTEFREEEGGV